MPNTMTNAEYRRKQRDRFALAVLGSGLLSQLKAHQAATAMFDLAEEMMAESERRFVIDSNKGRQ